MTIQNQEIEEVKSSFGVNAEVADAIDKKAVAPGKVQKNGDQESESIPQGSSLPKTKISMINAVMSKLSKMKKEDVEQQLDSMEEDELDEEQIDEANSDNPEYEGRLAAIDMHHYKEADQHRRTLQTLGTQGKLNTPEGKFHKVALEKHQAALNAMASSDHESMRKKLKMRSLKKEEYEMMDEEGEQMDEAFPDASGKLRLNYTEYRARMNKLSNRQLKYHQKKHEREYGPDTGERGPTGSITNYVVDKRGKVKNVTREDIDVSEDIAAAFSGSDLSEEFKAQATQIFETAVVSAVNMKLAEIAEQAEQEYAEEMQNIEEGLTTKIDEYLDYVVEQWMEENKLAVESGLRSEVTENFLSGLRNLFAENWIDIPEEKVEVVEELASEVEHITASLDEEMQKNIELKKQVEKFEREIAFVDVSEGLTEMQIAKFESLAEAVDYENAESYKERLETIRTSFFESRSQDVTEGRTTLDEEFIETSEISEKKLEPNMQVYSAAISRSVKK